MLIQTAHRKHDLILFAFATTFTALILLTGAPWALLTEACMSPPSPAKRIREIQGIKHISPVDKMTVSDVTGIVTAKRPTGVFFQDPSPDTDPRTSEGIFVFTSTPPANVSVGDSVLISGTITERRSGGNGESNANLTVTQITSSSVTVVSSGNPLPSPIIIGTGGRLPPTEIIKGDANGNVEISDDFDPASDGIDFYESLEGMLVQVNDAVVVGPTYTLRSGVKEIPVIGNNGDHAGVRTARGGIIVRPNDFNPERIFLSGEITVLPDLDVGDRFGGAIKGVLDYSSGNYKLIVTDAPAPTRSGLTREATLAAKANQLSVAAFNVENLSPSDRVGKFQRLANLIVSNLRSPDIISVEEIQDNNGPIDDLVVDATETFDRLISAIKTAGGPDYAFRYINPILDQEGGERGGNIRVGFIFRSDRGLKFVDRPGGGPTTSTTIESGEAHLSSSPGRVDPMNPAFNQTRKSLAGEFTFNGHQLFVIANHFSSKGGDEPLFGRFQPPAHTSETRRNQQAQVINGFVKSILAVDPRANVIALGDFNDFEFSTSLNKLKGGVLRNLIETLPQNERYTYVFEGNSQTLDHILVTNKLSYSLVRFEVVHINSEFLEQASDHDPTVAIFRLPVRRSHLQGKRISPTVFWKLAPRPQRNVIRQ